MSIPIYGIDKELGTELFNIAEKAAEKYDPAREAQARAWLEEVIGESSGNAPFIDYYLKDGVVLCKAVLKIIPNAGIPKPNVSKMPFKQMENINNFLQAMDKLGVPKHDQFQTIDLYEGKNPGAVVDGIFAFARHAHKKGYTNVLLGPKLSDKHEVQFTEEQIQQGKTIVPMAMKGSTGANQSGMIFGARREVIPNERGGFHS
ncbi:Muscle-specific protein 20 [Boothiomyces sp. JEL0866]|nr:Muscle-specific protein 20 [Boothiomyces sp. JEL0866]